MTEWRLMQGDTLIGELTERGCDQPFFLMYFSPGPGWEKVRALFEGLAALRGPDPDGSQFVRVAKPLQDLELILVPVHADHRSTFSGKRSRSGVTGKAGLRPDHRPDHRRSLRDLPPSARTGPRWAVGRRDAPVCSQEWWTGRTSRSRPVLRCLNSGFRPRTSPVSWYLAQTQHLRSGTESLKQNLDNRAIISGSTRP